MSVELLDRIRKINKLLHTNASNVFVFNDICLALSDAMDSNVMVLSRKGKILGMGNTDPALIEPNWTKASVGIFIDPNLNERLLTILSTKENVHLETLGFDVGKRTWSYVEWEDVDLRDYLGGTMMVSRYSDGGYYIKPYTSGF